MLTGGSLCTGGGGLDLGLGRALGIRWAWHAEPDRDAARVLDAHSPGIPNLGDVFAVEWEEVERVDLVAAGFPCPDYSVAGRRKGIDGEHGQVWFGVAAALRALRPALVVLENVDGIRTARGPVDDDAGELALGVVLADLAALGYDVCWSSLRASDVGAPHGRRRWFCAGALAPDAERRGIDADGRLRRRAPGEPRPDGSAPPALAQGQEVVRSENAFADGRGFAPDADLDGREGERPREPGGRGEPPRRGGAPPDAERERLDGRGVGDARPPARDGRHGRAVAPGSPEAASDPGSDGLVREPPLDGADGGVDVAPGDEPHGRDLGGPGPRDGHAREAPSDAPGERRGGRAARPEPGDARDGKEALGNEGGRSARDGDRQGNEAPADAGDGEPEVAEGDDVEHGQRSAERRRQLESAGPRADSGDSGGPLAEGPPAVRGTPAGDEGDRGLARVEWGVYEAAVRRWERIVGRPAPAPTDERGRLHPEFVTWMLGYPEGYVNVEGVSRTAQLKILGNSVQVQCAERVGAWIPFLIQADLLPDPWANDDGRD